MWGIADMVDDLQTEIKEWRERYFHLGQELGDIINEQQDAILSLQRENKRLKSENWNLRRTKRK